MDNFPKLESRVRRMAHVLFWCSTGSPQETLIDLLADGMHWCDANGEDFFLCLAQSCRHYIHELNNDQHDERRLS
jgi:hypothetical protein